MRRIIILSVLVFSLIALWSCQKDLPTIPDNMGQVKFSPLMYGEVVPWNDNKKAFGDFVHLYFNHVIRIRTGAGVFVIDIPITINPSNSYFYSLTPGEYRAEVIPVSNATVNGPGTYTVLNLLAAQLYTTLNRAPIYTRTAVDFTVTAAQIASVTLDCVTDFSCLQFSLGGVTYLSAGTPKPELVGVVNTTVLAAHNSAGLEAIDYATLNGLGSLPNRWTVGARTEPTIPGAEYNGLWWDETSQTYYTYYAPGTPNTLSIPNGTGNNTSYTQASASYLGFDIGGGTGADYPVLWLKDFYNTRTFLGNMCIRVTFGSGGTFTVNQQPWFQTIIDGNN